MSVFGTINKEDGTMPTHFDERGIISCVFHLGSVMSGGSTSFYSGSSPSEPGEKIHCVPIIHGSLQVFFLIECYMEWTIGRASVVVYK